MQTQTKGDSSSWRNVDPVTTLPVVKLPQHSFGGIRQSQVGSKLPGALTS